MDTRIHAKLSRILLACLISAFSNTLCAQRLPLVNGTELQPLAANAERVVQTLELMGSPLAEDQQAALRTALADGNAAAVVESIQRILDPLCLVGVTINPESRVTVQEGAAPQELMQQGWRVFLVKVHNQAGVTAALRCTSPNAEPIHDTWINKAEPPQTITQGDVVQRWLDVGAYDKPPLNERLSGLALE